MAHISITFPPNISSLQIYLVSPRVRMRLCLFLDEVRFHTCLKGYALMKMNEDWKEYDLTTMKGECE